MRITEPVNVINIFAEKLGRIDVTPDGGFARLLLCVTRFAEDGATEERVAAVVTMPISAIPDAILKAAKATAVGLMGVPMAMAN